MYRILYFIFLSLFYGCESPRPSLSGLPTDSHSALYFTNAVRYQQDSLAGWMGTDHPAVHGIVVSIALNGKLNYPIDGTERLEQLIPLLAEHPNWYPVLTTYFGESVFRNFCSGKYMTELTDLARWFKRTGRPGGITVGYQLNSSTWGLPPRTVIEGYRCFVDYLRASGAENIQFGWYLSSLNPSYRDSEVMDYYPGEEYVDFIATDLARFTDHHFQSQNADVTGSNLPRLTELANVLNLPIVVVDANPTAAYRLLPSSDDGIYGEFFAPLDSTLRNNPRITAFTVVPGDIPDSTSLDSFLITYLSN